MEKVSIIVTAYNIEKYIKRCLDTIVNQTYRNLEIIIVNDGSTDNTLKEINKYVGVDDRIIVINQSNKGPSNSRKNGYDKSTGEYILFVDGDDWLEKDTIEILYNYSKGSNSDVTCFGFVYDSGIEKQITKGSTIKVTNYEEEQFLEELLLSKIQPSICSKFIRKNFIEKKKVEWPKDINFAEDLATSCSIAIYKPRVIKLNTNLYHYYQRQGSITKVITDNIYDINKAINFIKKQLVNANLLNKYEKQFEYLSFIHNYYYRFHTITDYNTIYSKELYKIWKRGDVYINKNEYIKQKLNKENKGRKMYMKLVDFNYTLGKLYSGIRGFNNES